MTVKAGQKCTAIRRALVPAEHRRRGGRCGRGAAGRRWSIGNPADESRADGRAGQPRTARGGAPLAQGAAVGRARSCSATRSTSRSSAPTPSAARSSRRSCCAPTTRPPPEVHEVEAFGPVSHGDRVPRHRRRHRARRARPGQPGRLGRHRRPGVRPRRRARHRAVARPAARARPGRRAPSRPATVRRCRCSCTAAPGGPAAARRWAASAACCTTCSAPPSRPARACSVRSPAAGSRGAPRRPTARTRSASRSRRCGSATPSSAGPRTVTLDDIEHFAEFTGDTFYAHMDEEAARANPFFDGRVAHGYLISRSRPGCSSSRTRPGPGQLRRRQPAFPHAGEPGRRADA